VAETASWPRRLANTGYLAALARFERSVPWWPRERIERLQRHRLRSIVRHAYATVPFYRDAMDACGLRPDDFRTVADLAKLPLLTGEEVRADPARFASTDFDDRSRYAYYSSGGRTHIRRLVYWDRASALRRVARAERDRVVIAALVGQLWGQRQLFLLAPTSLSMEGRDRWDRQTVTSRWLARRHLVPPETPFEAVAEEINAFQPQVIFSYGSYADQFARFVADRGLAIALPKVWVYGGDMLSPGGRELIERRLGCLVYSTYQAAETGRLGFQCERRDGFHLNVDLCAVRLADEAGRDVAPGQLGEVVISNLHNRATVLLNYRLGDQGILAAAPCPCGRSLPLLARLEGRTSEQVTLGDGRVLTSLDVLALFRVELRAALKAQVVHPGPGVVRWRIVPLPGADQEALRRRLVERGRDVLGDGTRIEVEFVDDIPSTPHGKFRRVVTAGDQD